MHKQEEAETVILKPAEHVFWKVAVQICWWHCFQRIMGQIVINMLSIWWLKNTTLSYQTTFSRIIKALKTSFCPTYTHPKPDSFLKLQIIAWLVGFQCICSLSLSLFISFFPALSLVLSIFLFCPLLRLSTPPLNRTIFSACYRAWSIPCYHREINYLDQAAGERGNNERMLLLRRR